MLHLFKKISKSDSDCCNVQILEITEDSQQGAEEKQAACCSADSKCC